MRVITQENFATKVATPFSCSASAFLISITHSNRLRKIFRVIKAISDRGKSNLQHILEESSFS